MPAHPAHSSATYVIDSICQLRYAHKQWGTTLSEKGKVWLAARAPAEPAAPTAPTAPAASFGMPNTIPFPNPWGGMGSLAGLGITIPPQLALAGTAGTGTIPLTAFGALARPRNHAPAGWDNAFQF